MKKQLIGIALILLGILLSTLNLFTDTSITMFIGLVLGVIGLFIVIAYAIDEGDK
ncbi:hypothetical protein [Mahella sp.]|uniref:hypothetical protein n=1 Tax=Mahella sp. TaxID=2798721 RepID=UPI0025BC9B80|nr:hypothetical protein [Mahella sp.]MBZ4665875.1 hypothetical protein [Mahella sp.]